MALRHDCFIVYHPADRELADAFIARFKDVFVPRARGITDQDGFIVTADTDRADLFHRIRDKYIWDARLTIVLTGPCTWASRYVDWEIAAALEDDHLRPPDSRGDPGGRRTGLLGIRLPSLASGAPATVPERFADNVDADFAQFRPYPRSSEELRWWVEGAQVKAQWGAPDNSRPLRLEDAACG